VSLGLSNFAPGAQPGESKKGKEKTMTNAIASRANTADRVVNGPRQEDEKWDLVVNGPCQDDEKWDLVVNGPIEEDEERERVA
jgi:hypothetical protein